MQIDNRNKKITQTPEIQEIIKDDSPIEEPKKDPSLEDLDTEEEKKPDVTPEPSIPATEDEPEEEEAEEKKEPEEDKKETPKEPEKEDPDYKRRYVESSKESLNLYFKNKQLVDTIEEASNLPEPTVEELIAYAKENNADYEYLDDFSKSMLKKTLINERRFQKIDDVNKEAKNYQVWLDKVNNFIDSPEVINKYQDIEDNAESFRNFCLKKERRGMSLDDLASSFLFGLANSPKPQPHKGSILLSKGNGANPDPKPAGIDEEEAKSIRTNNPKEYRRLVKEGKIKIDI